MMDAPMQYRPGPLVLFGSGELADSAQSVYDRVLRVLGPPYRVAVLETPAGFEPNSEHVAGRVADYIRQHLQNYRPEVTVVPARKRGTAFSPDDPRIVAPLFEARMIFLGPGSPTYAVRQLRRSLAWQVTLARYLRGAALVLASAATIAAGQQALPVYEIYKAGEDLHWVGGLDVFSMYGLSLVLVPHWNNNDGGVELDTSRCFMGSSRFAGLLALLPPGISVLGIDEHTAVWLDLAGGTGEVISGTGATLIRGGVEQRFVRGEAFALSQLGPLRPPEARVVSCEYVPDSVWEQVLAAERSEQAGQEAGNGAGRLSPPQEVLALVETRQAARARRDWPAADTLRARILALGWQANDTPSGTDLTPVPKQDGK